MAEHRLDGFRIGSSADGQGRCGVPQIVRRHRRKVLTVFCTRFTAGAKTRGRHVLTGVHVEQLLGVRLSRSKDPAVDWVDANGKTYDAVGPFQGKFFDKQWPQFSDRIVDHLGKADIVPVDISQFNPEQQAVVRAFCNQLNSPKIVIVGGRP
jgi:hypothetical protein